MYQHYQHNPTTLVFVFVQTRRYFQLNYWKQYIEFARALAVIYFLIPLNYHNIHKIQMILANHNWNLI